MVDRSIVDWPESKFFLHHPFETPFFWDFSFSYTSFLNWPTAQSEATLSFFVCYFIHHIFLSLPHTVAEPAFQTKNGFLYKSTVCHHRDQIYLEPENCCYQCWYTHAQIEQRKRQILSFTKNRLLNITLGHQKQLLYDRRQALDSNLCLVKKKLHAAVKC